VDLIEHARIDTLRVNERLLFSNGGGEVFGFLGFLKSDFSIFDPGELIDPWRSTERKPRDFAVRFPDSFLGSQRHRGNRAKLPTFFAFDRFA